MNEQIFEGERTSIRVEVAQNAAFPRLNPQEQMVCAAILAGASVAEASRRAGTDSKKAHALLKQPHIQAYLDHKRAQFERDVLPHVSFTLEDAHHMYMTAYRNSGNATEQVKATDALVKLHRIGDKPAEKEINPTKMSATQLANVDTATLLRLAQIGLESIHPVEGDLDE